MIATITLNPSIDRTLAIDRLVVGGMNRVRSKIDHPSGKGINASLTLSSLGQSTEALAFIGGESGRWLVKALLDQGLAVDCVEVEGDTRINLKVWSEKERQSTEINEPGPLVTEKELAELKSKVFTKAKHWDWVVISGSVPPGTPKEFYAALVETAKGQGAKVALDASGPALSEGITAMPDLIKPNEVEASELLGFPVEDEKGAIAAVEELTSRGIDYVLLTLGKDGAVIGHGGRMWRALTPKVRVESTVGCGDSAIAGMLHGLMKEEGIEEAIRWAIATGAAAAGTRGTTPPKLAVVTKLLSEVKLQRI